MNIDYEKDFGKNLRRIRESKKMTQEMVAARMQLRGCDITRSAVAKIEVGQRHIYADEILILKEIFDVKFDEMFYKKDN
ncbi:MAG: helix-turn-helix transcriptional regulator [Clostridia bacterium]|mgnify:CR=1 FL=1|nr:helix-turn-helix transcriptional regulator [Clostridia bacterium]